ncbi:DUF6794 domain-containing protein [Draconibacterium halophilum]|uniref:DUF6794 domain-containing protein n=1 Tax=Draconibacterium halophilum TaxID=2706887 RepID=A0A6C0RFJ1_9BACT|nr:DUF6794 domain-containing protein [Draconibacterium halophilum]QIA08837.1 hypothetical protein G0Q07_14405 [Draconibacterium halophilum]
MNKRFLIFCFLLVLVNLIGFSQSAADSLKIDIYSSDSINGIYIPKDLNDCFIQIDGFWNDSIKTKVQSWTENEFCGNAHLGFGMWMRNNWGLWSGSRLQVYFKDKGIYHPDDMSGIILTSYHRYLTGKDVELKKQIKEYKAYWKSTNAKQTSLRFEAKTIGNRKYTNIDTALLYTDSIIDIELIGYTKLPKKLNKFSNLSKLTIEDCPNLDFHKAFNSLANYQNLTELYLFDNRINDYPSNLGDLSRLKNYGYQEIVLQNYLLKLKK